jgi:hypothetical protein
MVDKKVAYIGGCWSTNIGNAFFNLGADYVLKQVFGDENVFMVADHSAFAPLWKASKGNIPYSINYWKHLDVDYVVLLGPILGKQFLPVWKDTLDTLKLRGIRYMILSAGMMKYTDEDIAETKAYFNENPPYLITTRDRTMYETFKDSVKNIYDGVCFAFFVPNYYKPVGTDLGKTIAVNFDKIDEPYIYIDNPKNKYKVEFDFEEHHFGMQFKNLSKIGLRTDRFTDALVYLASPLPRGKRSEKLGEYTIIRPDHRYNPLFIRKVYRYPNSFCSDIPHTYVNIYANADLTISDRVHACAISLAYGNSAYLFAKTGRSELLTRVGAECIYDHPVKINLEYLNSEKLKLIEWLKSMEY